MAQTDSNTSIKEIGVDKYFRFQDGQIAKNPVELLHILPNLNPSVFDFHLNQNKNDFANWVEDVFNNHGLGKEMRSVTSKPELIAVLGKYFDKKEEEVPEQPQQEIEKKATEQHDKIENNNAAYESPETNNPAKEDIQVKSADSVGQPGPETVDNTDNSNTSNEQTSEVPPVKENTAKSAPKLDINRIDKIKESIHYPPIEKASYEQVLSPDSLAKMYEDTHSKLYSRCSELRKSGKDTRLAELMLMRIKPRIKLFRATLGKKDSHYVEQLIEDAREEINHINSLDENTPKEQNAEPTKEEM
ncbi:hypothetical protein JW930_02280 [Candidatus Woesearchaeota archaeon]|nr:hypothetical protein [Candidatus Woesearchaeota archaeon]